MCICFMWLFSIWELTLEELQSIVRMSDGWDNQTQIAKILEQSLSHILTTDSRLTEQFCCIFSEVRTVSLFQ